MKKILITSLLCVSFLTSLNAAETGKVKLTKSPIDTNFLSTENGGSKSAIDAYSDGVGMKVVGNSITVDNSKMNNSVFTDGLLAKNEVVSLKEFLNNKNSGSGENIEVIGASVGLTTVIGDPCNDGNSNTGNDIYVDENGTCLGLPIKTENKCYEDLIGTEFIFNGKNFLVVNNFTIRDNLDRAETLCVSNVTDMSNLFSGYETFNGDISSWDVSNVTDMDSLFSGSSFNQNISNWDVSNVTNMRAMFMYASSFNQPLNNWAVSKVTNMSNMFSNATAFNQPLNNWNVSNVTIMRSMFTYASSFNQPLNNWDVSNVSDMSVMFMFASSFNQPLNNWYVSNVSDMSIMFMFASSFNQNLRSWNVNNALSFNGFRTSSALTSANSAQKTISPYTIF